MNVGTYILQISHIFATNIMLKNISIYSKCCYLINTWILDHNVCFFSLQSNFSKIDQNWDFERGDLFMNMIIANISIFIYIPESNHLPNVSKENTKGHPIGRTYTPYLPTPRIKLFAGTAYNTNKEKWVNFNIHCLYR